VTSDTEITCSFPCCKWLHMIDCYLFSRTRRTDCCNSGLDHIYLFRRTELCALRNRVMCSLEQITVVQLQKNTVISAYWSGTGTARTWHLVVPVVSCVTCLLPWCWKLRGCVLRVRAAGPGRRARECIPFDLVTELHNIRARSAAH